MTIVFAQIVNIMLNMVLVGLIARYLGLSGYGQYYYIYAFILIFEVASDLGLQTIAVREIAKAKAKAAEILGNAILLKIFISVITLAFVFFFAQLRIEPSLRTAFYIAGLAAVTQMSTDFFSWLFCGFEKMEFTAVFAILNRMVFALLVILGIHLKYDVTYFFFALLLSNLMRILAESFIALRKFPTPTFRIDFRAWKSLLFQSAPLGLSVLMMITSRRLNIFLLNFLRTDGDVGLFSSVFVIISAVVIFIPNTFSFAAFPVYSHLASTSRDSLIKSYEMSFKLLVVLSIPITVSFFLLANKFILLIFGNDFTRALGTMQIMSLSLMFRFLNLLFRSILTSINKQTYELIGVSISLLLSAVLGYLFISLWGCWGAGLTLFVVEVFIFTVKFYFVSKFVSLIPIVKIVTKPIICALLMGSVILLFQSSNLFFLIFLGSCVYISTLLLLKNFSTEELTVFRRAIRWQTSTES